MSNHGNGWGADYDAPTVRTKRNLKPWHVLGLGALAIIVVCFVAAALFAAKPLPVDKAIPPYETASSPGTVRGGTASGTAVHPDGPLIVKGKGNSVAPTRVTLNGAYNVQYTFGSWCGIASFLTSDGRDGAGILEGINDCGDPGNPAEKLTGSTIVHLKNVTQVKVENTRGDWTLTFTPIS